MFEYLVFDLDKVLNYGGPALATGRPSDAVRQLMGGLNKLGREGWELCVLLPPPLDMVLFKRRISFSEKLPESRCDLSEKT